MKELPQHINYGRPCSVLAAAARRRKQLLVRKEEMNNMRGVKKRMKRLKVEMEEIGKEQASIRKVQQEVRLKIEAVGAHCRQLGRETHLLTQQSARTSMQLQLIFQILRARHNHDLEKTAQLTLRLRRALQLQAEA